MIYCTIFHNNYLPHTYNIILVSTFQLEVCMSGNYWKYESIILFLLNIILVHVKQENYFSNVKLSMLGGGGGGGGFCCVLE